MSTTLVGIAHRCQSLMAGCPAAEILRTAPAGGAAHPAASGRFQSTPKLLQRPARSYLAMLFGVACLTNPASAALILNNGFEGGTADWGPGGDWNKSTGNVLVSTNAREGSKSVQFLPNAVAVNDRRSEFTVNNGDGSYAWGTEYWMGFSVLVVQPSGGFGIIFQHHSTPAVVGGATDWNHSSGENSFTILTKGNNFDVRTATIPSNVNGTTLSDPNYRTNAQTGAATWGTANVSVPYVTNRWYDFVLHFRLSPDTNGIMEVWVKDTVTGVNTKRVNVTNNVTVYRYDSGRAASTSSGVTNRSGLPKTPVNNQKFGLYYGTGNEDIAGSVLYDAFRIWEGAGGSYAAVAPIGNSVPVAPAAPSGLNATLVSSNQINLNWTDASTNETQFRLERKVNGGSFAFLTNRPAIAGSGGSGTYSDLNLSAGTTYTYRVRADGTNGNDSVWSSEVSTNTPGSIGGGGATNQLEAELLAALSNLGAGAISTFGETNASGGTNSLFTTTATNNFITYTVNVPANGTYNLRVMLNKAVNRGRCNLYVDDSTSALGAEMDLYNASGYAYQEVNLGDVTFTNVGAHTLKFLLTGKNASATTYKLAFDYLKLINTDTNAPTVSMTAPADGASVSGPTVSVTAEAADNVGVVGVQFKLDGDALGVEDTTAPYTVVWDTTTVTDGDYTLTAVVRDAAGNITTSSELAVTVINHLVQIAPPVITGAAVSNNNFVLTFTTEIGGQYEMQRTETLSPANWIPMVTNIPGNDDQIQITDTNALSRPGTFYRVKLLGL